MGKSTLVSRVSAAKPKIADYPFTTLEPNLGVVRLDDGFEYVVADIPGLIEGASEGRGLGHRFLRHIERARVLVLLVDLAGGDTGMNTALPAEQVEVLLRELGQYQPDLVDRPRLVVGSRADLVPEVLDLAQAGEGMVTGDGVTLDLCISAVTGAGLPHLVGRMADAVRGARSVEPEPEGFVVHRPLAEGVSVEREDDGSFRVLGTLRRACGGPVGPHQPRSTRLRPRPAQEARRRQGPGPGRRQRRRHRPHRAAHLRVRGRMSARLGRR